ncbi:MAG: Gfo/Idh/MocA family oxidoreductase [Magnetococcales bacterium]|nr:Gfo/Idh/MocA family oxidoreductase [Magnetococcales bacterium]
MKQPRLGLIGAGRWGKNIIKSLRSQKAVVLAGLATSNPDNRQLVGPETTLHANWEDMVAQAPLDGVIIATPPDLHGWMVTAALNRGLAVLVEKPLTLNLGEAQALYRLAQSRRGRVMVDHIHLYNHAWEALAMIQPACGPITGFTGAAGQFGPFRREVPVLWDWGAHEVALCLSLLNRDPEQVAVSLVERRLVDGLPGEIFDLILDFGRGVVARLRLGNLLPGKQRRLTVHCQDGDLTFDDVAAAKLAIDYRGPGRAPAVPPLSSQLPLDHVLERFGRMVGQHEYDLGDLDLAVRVVRVLERCQDAWQEAGGVR